MDQANKSDWHEHIPVLLQPCLDYLITDPEGVYIDGTLGGGGHTQAILQKLGPNAQVFGFDQDPQAHEAAKERIGQDKRFHPVVGNFAHMFTLLSPDIRAKVSGVLLDLGVSTHQLKAGERGFSHKHDGPLDMRMSTLAPKTAKEVVNAYEETDLARIIFRYGEERLSRKIATAIVSARPLHTTGELKKVIESVVKGRFVHKSVARVFQAIRIEVNAELQALEAVLKQQADILAEGGRLCIISYHSLEDRLVKNFLRAGKFEGEAEKDLYGSLQRPFEPLFNKVIKPSEEEIERNTAARSARLRVGVRTTYGGAA